MKGNLAEVMKVESGVLDARDLLTEACSLAKGTNIEVLDLRQVNDVADYFIIVSGRSDRQVQGIGNRVLEAGEKAGLEPISIEGFEKGHWILVDFGNIVVHVFYEPTREHYDLESLWSEAVRVQIAA